MEDFQSAFTLVLDYLEHNSKISSIMFESWVKRLKPIDIDFKTKTVTLETISEFHANIIKGDNILPYIKDALLNTLGYDFNIDIIFDTNKNSINSKSSQVSLFEKNSENYNKPQSNSIFSNYTFSNFVVGSSNKFCYSAALSVAENPGNVYNPLFIYSKPGLGKTHLIKAIENYVKQNFNDMYVKYIKSEDFNNQLIEAIRHGTTSEFQKKYRLCDVLLVDDIQFIAGKHANEEEFFHTFNTLYESNKQIVLTSDRPPSEMVRLEERLRTRFASGLVSDITPPDFETRMAIIKKKSEDMNLNLDDSIINYIAENVKDNIRHIEGVLKNISSKINFNISITKQECKKTIDKIVISNKVISVDNIIEEVSKTFNIEVSQIKSESRMQRVSQARQIAMFLCRELTDLSLVDIGSYFSSRNHSTVKSSIDKVEKNMNNDIELADLIDNIRKNIKEG